MRERLRSKHHSRDRSLGWLALDWISWFCVHGPGDVQGVSLWPDDGEYDPETGTGSLPIDDEFCEFVVDAYALNEKGRRLYTSAFISRAKGRSKSELAGWIVLFEALGPCRFAGFAEGGEVFEQGTFRYEYQPGEPMGRVIQTPYIRCLATEESQAGNTYDNVYLNLSDNPKFECFGLKKSDVGLTRINIPGGGEIVPSTASSSAKDGGKETFAVFDESHLYTTPELHRMYGVVTRNLDKRKAAEPWALETSTMYAPGEDSIAEQTHKTAKLIAEGKLNFDNIFFDHRQAESDTNIGDRDDLKRGLTEAYGPASAWMDLDRMCDAFYDIRRPVSDQRRYFLNQPTAAADAWLIPQQWDACSAPRTEVKRKEQIALGFDGSQKRSDNKPADSTALIACRISDGHLWPLGIWEQPAGPDGDGWSVPIGEVMNTVDFAFKEYDVIAFFADPQKWEGIVTDWERDYGPRLKIKAAPKNPIAYWMHRTREVGYALDRFETAVRDRELTHDGNPTLTRHAYNARRKPRGDAMGIGKEHPQSRNKIDAIVAAVLAYQARAYVLAQAPKARRVFKAIPVLPQ